MTVAKSFPWKSLVFVLLLSIITVFIYDIKQHGDWQKTKSVRTLKDIGVWEYGEKTWDKANQGLNWTKQRIEEYAPGYIDTASEIVQPYVEVTRDLGLVLYNLGDTYRLIIVDKYPQVVQFVEKHAPGMIESLQSNVKAITIRTGELFSKGYDYIATQIFVGELAPENMQKVILNALNTTQQYAAQYYHWVYEKIETTINGK